MALMISAIPAAGPPTCEAGPMPRSPWTEPGRLPTCGCEGPGRQLTASPDRKAARALPRLAAENRPGPCGRRAALGAFRVEAGSCPTDAVGFTIGVAGLGAFPNYSPGAPHAPRFPLPSHHYV